MHRQIREYISDSFNEWTGSDHDERKKTVVSTTSQQVRLGEIIGLEYIIGNASETITVTFNLYDTHGVLIFTQATIAKNVTTVARLKYTTGSTTIPLFGEGFVIGFDPSGDSGTTKITCQLRVYYS